jgi:hypothetical protein
MLVGFLLARFPEAMLVSPRAATIQQVSDSINVKDPEILLKDTQPLQLSAKDPQEPLGKPVEPSIRTEAYCTIFERSLENVLNNWIANADKVPKRPKSFRALVQNLVRGQILKFEAANKSFFIEIPAVGDVVSDLLHHIQTEGIAVYTGNTVALDA